MALDLRNSSVSVSLERAFGTACIYDEHVLRAPCICVTGTGTIPVMA